MKRTWELIGKLNDYWFEWNEEKQEGRCYDAENMRTAAIYPDCYDDCNDALNQTLFNNELTT